MTDKIRNKSIRCQSFKPFRRLSDRVSRFYGMYDIDSEYDLSKAEKLTISLFDLSSEVMHSYIFDPEVNNESILVAFFVDSHRHMDNRVLRIDLVSYISAATAVASDNVVAARVWKDPKTGRIRAELR